jgi:hypothetical protein
MTQREALIQKIFSAFEGVTLGNGVGLYEAQAIDYYASAETRKEYRNEDETENWKNIPVTKLFQYWDSPSFLDAEGMRFHLPLYLLIALEYFDDEIEELIDNDRLMGTSPDIEFHLTSVLDYLDDDNEEAAQMIDFHTERFSLLNDDQISCVIEFLEFQTVGFPAKDTTKLHLEKAIQYWKQKSTARD